MLNLNYDEFKNCIIDSVVSFLPEKYKNAVPSIEPIKKTNTVKDGLRFTGNNLSISPVIYVDNLYELYSKDKDIDKVLKNIAEIFINHVNNKEIKNIVGKIDKDMIKKNVFIQLINTDKNRDTLKDIPSRKFLDLSMIYKLKLEISGSGITTLTINKHFMKHYGFDENDLYNIAIRNTKRLFPFYCRTITETLGDLTDVDMDDLGFNPAYDDMLVLSNRQCNLGAHVMLYQDELLSLANKLNSDLYIIPSSIHEILVKPTSSGITPDMLKFTISSVNDECVSPNEFLSNNLYLFSKDTGEITIV